MGVYQILYLLHISQNRLYAFCTLAKWPLHTHTQLFRTTVDITKKSLAHITIRCFQKAILFSTFKLNSFYFVQHFVTYKVKRPRFSHFTIHDYLLTILCSVGSHPLLPNQRLIIITITTTLRNCNTIQTQFFPRSSFHFTQKKHIHTHTFTFSFDNIFFS